MTANVIKAGNPITFAVVPGQSGMPNSATTVHLEVFNEKRESVWHSETPLAWNAVTTNGATFPKEASADVVEGSGYRIFGIFTLGDQGQETGKIFYEVIVESSNQLQPLVNSFASWGELIMVSRTLAGMTAFSCCTFTGAADTTGIGGEGNAPLLAALINAYHNIGYVNVDFCPPRHRSRYHSQSHMWDHEGIFESDIDRVVSTRQLTPELWAKLRPDQREKLIRAQVIEANFLMSGNTPEKQRLAGLLSHSAGESAHFYRTSKPLELPVCRATANALKGIITYVARIGG